jgi:hypothetical protein
VTERRLAAGESSKGDVSELFGALAQLRVEALQGRDHEVSARARATLDTYDNKKMSQWIRAMLADVTVFHARALMNLGDTRAALDELESALPELVKMYKGRGDVVMQLKLNHARGLLARVLLTLAEREWASGTASVAEIQARIKRASGLIADVGKWSESAGASLLDAREDTRALRGRLDLIAERVSLARVSRARVAQSVSAR